VDLEQGRVPPRCLDHDCVAQGAGRDAVVESAAGPPSQVGNATGARAWRDYRVQPWRVETFTFATDPELVGKVTDVVGLYMVPPQNAIVLCVDAKSQVQALDRTAPMLPMQPGRPERRTHAYRATARPPVRGAGGRSRPARSPPPTNPGTGLTSSCASSSR